MQEAEKVVLHQSRNTHPPGSGRARQTAPGLQFRSSELKGISDPGIRAPQH